MSVIEIKIFRDISYDPPNPVSNKNHLSYEQIFIGSGNKPKYKYFRGLYKWNLSMTTSPEAEFYLLKKVLRVVRALGLKK